MSQIELGRRITVAEMAPHVHSFLPHENKVNKISEWLINWINMSLKAGTIKPYDYLPTKADLAFHIGVSLGTIQNVFRLVEDEGIIESRQKIGTYIKNKEDKKIEKLTSKREVAIETIKQHITEAEYKTGDKLLSARKLSKILAIPFATIRMAMNTLVSEGVVKKEGSHYIITSLDFTAGTKEPQTLVEKIAEHINQYIKNNLKVGDKLPSNNALSDMFNVSIKTIHDAIKILSLAGIVRTRRGYYGTVVTNMQDNTEEKYFYEQVEQGIKKYMAENCKIGAKLPSIKTFAEVFNVSAKTIKNALNNLENDGYVNLQRGRNGGTFVLEIPTSYEQGYTWLALSSDFEQIN